MSTSMGSEEIPALFNGTFSQFDPLCRWQEQKEIHSSENATCAHRAGNISAA
jgi:hypothetical protein